MTQVASGSPDIDTVRRFNRFYTRQIGILQEGVNHSPFSLSEARVLYELAQRPDTTATRLRELIGLDAGYLSRMLAAFERRRLVTRRPSEDDGRQQLIRLTPTGAARFAELEAATRQDVEKMLERLDGPGRALLLTSMRRIEQLLGEDLGPRVPYLLRPHRVGDMGWVVHRHGLLYNQEYGWNEQFEATVAEIAAHFLQRFDARRERAWIAERNGERVGSVLLVQHPEQPQTTAKLRLLLVEPSARGLGIGRQLVSECTRFARQVGYSRITLWTNSLLLAARRLYELEGYRLVESSSERAFGHDQVFETWELALR